MKTQILIFAENTRRPGQRCWEEDRASSDDLVEYLYDSPAELRELVAAAKAQAAEHPSNSYLQALHRTLAEELRLIDV